jgi:hypothetical protein
MSDLSGRRKEEIGYRKGVLLGLTVAEIVLLLLFALLLALWGQISSMKIDIEKAKIINSKFSSIINQNSPSGNTAAEIEKLIKAEINYSEKLAKELEKYKNNLLPDDVFELIKSQNFDLKKAEDRDKFFNLIKIATKITSTSDVGLKDFANQCNAGQSVISKFKGVDPDRILSDLNHWKGVAATCGKGNSLPSCYQQNGKDVAIFEARLNDQGILIKNTVPIEMIELFSKDFPSPPTFNTTLTDNEFRQQTAQFSKYSREKECRFRVNAYDDTGVDKKYFQKIEKILDSVFLKWKHW